MSSFPTYKLELELKNKGYQYIIGVDEAGRGPLAGPVVAAAVHIPDGFDTDGINDSKKLSSKNRELFYNNITKSCTYAIAEVDEKLIDEINIREATKLAMRKVIYNMPKADFVLVDGNFVPEFIDMPAQPIIKGDSLSVSIAAASIIAKVWRDKMMDVYHIRWPAYGFNTNRGYGTKHHREMIKMIGPCSIHRKSFRRVKEYVQ
jgi:ribonuclease HII